MGDKSGCGMSVECVWMRVRECVECVVGVGESGACVRMKCVDLRGCCRCSVSLSVLKMYVCEGV